MTADLNLNDTAFERLPPQSIDGEQAILGALLINTETISRVIDVLEPEHFYRKAHQVICAAIIDLYEKNEPIDIVTLSQFLKDQGKLDSVGGRQYLTDLALSISTTANAEYYAKTVNEKALLRNLIKAGSEIVASCYEEPDADLCVDKAEQLIFSIAQRRSLQNLTHIGSIVSESFARIEKRYEQRDALSGIPTGFYDLDEMTSGWQKSDLIIVAARPSMGKCLAFDSEIMLSDGSLSTIGNLYAAGTAKLLTLDSKYQLRWTRPSIFVDDGIKPVYKVTTRLGRTIETTLSHPFLTRHGWQPLADLRTGDQIAIPRELPSVGHARMSEYQVKLTAYLLGAGCISNGNFSNGNSRILNDFRQAVEEFHGSPSRLANLSDGTTSNAEINPEERLSELGLSNENIQARSIPSSIFRLIPEQISLFLNRLFSTDGWVSLNATGRPQIGYATTSRRLAGQVQHLLLRFGVVAKLRQAAVGKTNKAVPGWRIEISDDQSLEQFSDRIGIFGKEAAMLSILHPVKERLIQKSGKLISLAPVHRLKKANGETAWRSEARQKDRQITAPWLSITDGPADNSLSSESNLSIHNGLSGNSSGKLNSHGSGGPIAQIKPLRSASAVDSSESIDLTDSAIFWDQIISVKYVGEKQVYDLTIPETHNFIANDICVHNTAFCLNLAQHAAVESKLPVALFSLEMSKEQLVQRLLCAEARIDANKMRTGFLQSGDWQNLASAMGRLSEAPIFIDDSAALTALDVRAKARRLKSEYKDLGLIIIDYIQLMSGRSRSDGNRVQEISEISRGLKQLARELNVPVIALSQLSRAVEARQNKRPMLSDLRESGAIEQDADIVMFIYRDEYYNQESDKRGEAEIIIAKQRNGPVGTVELLYQASITRFLNKAVTNSYASNPG